MNLNVTLRCPGAQLGPPCWERLTGRKPEVSIRCVLGETEPALGMWTFSRISNSRVCLLWRQGGRKKITNTNTVSFVFELFFLLKNKTGKGHLPSRIEWNIYYFLMTCVAKEPPGAVWTADDSTGSRISRIWISENIMLCRLFVPKGILFAVLAMECTTLAEVGKI